MMTLNKPLIQRLLANSNIIVKGINCKMKSFLVQILVEQSTNCLVINLLVNRVS